MDGVGIGEKQADGVAPRAELAQQRVVGAHHAVRQALHFRQPTGTQQPLLVREVVHPLHTTGQVQVERVAVVGGLVGAVESRRDVKRQVPVGHPRHFVPVHGGDQRLPVVQVVVVPQAVEPVGAELVGWVLAGEPQGQLHPAGYRAEANPRDRAPGTLQ